MKSFIYTVLFNKSSNSTSKFGKVTFFCFLHFSFLCVYFLKKIFHLEIFQSFLYCWYYTINFFDCFSVTSFNDHSVSDNQIIFEQTLQITFQLTL